MSMNQGKGRHIVVAGASFAGLGAAYSLRQHLPREDRITVVDPNGQFTFAPSLVWAALGTPLLHSSFALEPALEAKGIEFIRSRVRAVNVGDHVVRTDDGELAYDRLVIATGGRPDTASIPGLAGELRAASWIVGEDSAMEARSILRDLFEDPGPLVVGAAQGASYISGAYELALALDTVLRRKGIRDRVPITFITAEPYLGHLGFGQSALQRSLEPLFAEKNIDVRTGVSVEYIRRNEIKVSSCETLPARSIVIMPPFTGVVDIWKSADLTDDTGLIPIDSQYRHTAHNDIYAVGVASSFKQPVSPLGFTRAPHTGYLSLHMGQRAGQNVAASLGAGQPAKRTLPYLVDLRVLDGGDAGVVAGSRGRTTLHHTAKRVSGRTAHALKGSIERYIIWRLRTGRMNLP